LHRRKFRRKKPTRKYKPRNEFRINDSPLAESHPHYIFGEINGKYKSLGLTTHPIDKVKKVKLKVNPKPGEIGDSYLQLRVHTAKTKYYSKKLRGWKFSKEDMPIVRHRIKEYKKSTNRKSKRGKQKKK